MRYILHLLLVLLLASCNGDKSSAPVNKHRNIPMSQKFVGKDSIFSIELSSPFQQLRYTGRDTLSTIFGDAIQDAYVIDNDTLSMIISIASYDDEVFNKRKDRTLFESAINMFLHSLNAKKTTTHTCKKNIKSTVLNGERTFFSFTSDGKRYFGVSEIYSRNARIHHLCIISKNKEDFLNSDHIALAFSSYQPR